MARFQEDRTVKRGYVDTAEGQVHFCADGTGPALLLLHQTPSCSTEYSLVMPRLASRHQVLAMDLLGHGNTDVPPDEYGIEDYARNAWHFLDALGVERTSIAGHHTGALVAIEMAVTNPERVAKLVLSGCLCWDEAERKANLDQFLRRTPSFATDGSMPHAFLELWEMQRSFCRPGTSPEIWWPSYTSALPMKERLHHGHVVACRYDVLSKLPLVATPTLLLFGTRDYFTFKYLDQAMSLVRNSRVRVLQDAGVFAALENPDDFAAAVLEFLSTEI